MAKKDKDTAAALIILDKPAKQYVDDSVYHIKRNGGEVNRSSFIRAAIKAVSERHPDISGIKTEDELVNLLVSNC